MTYHRGGNSDRSRVRMTLSNIVEAYHGQVHSACSLCRGALNVVAKAGHGHGHGHGYGHGHGHSHGKFM